MRDTNDKSSQSNTDNVIGIRGAKYSNIIYFCCTQLFCLTLNNILAQCVKCLNLWVKALLTKAKVTLRLQNSVQKKKL